VYTVKSNYNTRQKYVGYRCSSFKHYLLLSVHVFSMWNILTTLQLTTMSVVPLCMLLSIHLQVTIIYVMFLLLISFGFTLFFACMLYQCHNVRKRNIQSYIKCCGSMCLYSVAITVTFGLILTLLVLYELMLLMLLVQVQIETGVKGIVLSLLPSFPLSALGWYMKKKISEEIQD